MTAFDARYYDGVNSAARSVRISEDGSARVRVLGDGIDCTLAREAVRVSARLGNSPRYLYLPGGVKCETDAHAAVDTVFAHRGGLVHALERRWALVALAVVCTVGVLWAGFGYGLPVLARHAAHAIPPAMESTMGEQSLRALDSRYLEPSRLTPQQRARVHAAFERVAAGARLTTQVRLELRHSEPFGPNAFALPSGIVIVTDAMVELAATDQEIMAVLAHEIGHVQHRHIMRSILQNSAVALLVATLLGDVTSITGLAASIPTFLVEQRYSRAFEYEADAFALAWMTAHGVAPAHLASILERLAHESGGDVEGFAQYLSTHPSMRERVKAIRSGAGS